MCRRISSSVTLPRSTWNTHTVYARTTGSRITTATNMTPSVIAVVPEPPPGLEQHLLLEGIGRPQGIGARDDVRALEAANPDTADDEGHDKDHRGGTADGSGTL